MATLRQILANRANAQKSTGPVTSEGKAAISTNAVKHGVFARDWVVEGDDPDDLKVLTSELLHEIAPRNRSETILAERIIWASWRLRRLAQAEKHMHWMLGEQER